MPVLGLLRPAFARQLPFAGLRIAACLHITAETAALVRTLTAGAIIFEVLCERLGVPLRVTRGGVREGAVIELRGHREAA